MTFSTHEYTNDRYSASYQRGKPDNIIIIVYSHGDSRLGFTVSAIWTIPARKKEPVQPEGQDLPDSSD